MLTALFLSNTCWSQSTADAVINRNEIMIGEQAVISLSCKIDKNNPAKITFPIILDTLVKNIEVVRKSTIDTLQTGENVSETRLEQKLYVTSFDSGYYAIPPFKFKIDGEIAETPAFLLTVKTVEIDTTAFIKGDRGAYQVDVSFLDYLKAYWKYPAAGAAVLAIVALILFLVRRYRKKEPEAPEPVEERDLRPAHVIATEALLKIDEEKIYKRGKVKDYHTAISDVLRDYLEGAYGIPASELTSRQIMNNLKYSGIEEREIQKLRTILFRADMVKFAKLSPDEQENLQAVADAQKFVAATIPPEKTEEPNGEITEK